MNSSAHSIWVQCPQRPNTCSGAPIRNVLGEVAAAISLAGPIDPLDDRDVRRHADLVVAAGRAVSRRLARQQRGNPLSADAPLAP